MMMQNRYMVGLLAIVSAPSYPLYLVNSKLAFVPPNPKLLLNAALTSPFLGPSLTNSTSPSPCIPSPSSSRIQK